MFIEECSNNTLAGWTLEILRKRFLNINRHGKVTFETTHEETETFCYGTIIVKVNCCIILLQYAKVPLSRKTQCRIVRFTSGKFSHFTFEIELNSGNIIEIRSYVM